MQPESDPPNPSSASVPQPPPPADDNVPDDLESLEKLRSAGLLKLSKSFGDIPGIPIFTEWDKRKDCWESAVHRSLVAGICGTRKIGAVSIVLSSLYKDDEDGGDVIIYTGAGGRQRWSNHNPPKRLRFGPQTEDQTWDTTSNRALMLSLETGNPVRVIRGSKCPSEYAPSNGYRYDGLYKVVDCWSAKGRNGKNICRCKLRRLPGQPPIPLREITFPASKRRQRRLFSPLASDSFTTAGSVGSNQTSTSESTTQFRGVPESVSGEFPSPPRQQGISTTSSKCEVGSNPGVPQSPPHERPISSMSSTAGLLPRYRWDSKRNELVRVPVSNPTQEDLVTVEEDEEEPRGDDATLVSSEDGCRVNDPERMETEFFSGDH